MKVAQLQVAQPVEGHVAADAAVVHQAEGRGQRHPAAEDDRVAGKLPQKAHSVVHDLRPRFVPARNQAGGIEEVEL